MVAPSPFRVDPASPKPSVAKTASSPATRGGPPPKPAVYGAPSGSQNLILSPYALVTPEDFDLGPLQYRHSSPDSAEGARSTLAYSFLDALVQKKLDTELLVPGKADALKRSLAPLLSNDIRVSSYRVGSIIPSGDNAYATVFLYAGTARAHGAVYLWRSGGKWLVDGFDLDLASLSVPRKGLPRKYEATEYRSFYY